jgi:hypothetical protein
VTASRPSDTTEAYGQRRVDSAYTKYSCSLTNLFGYADRKGSGYLDVGGGLTIDLRAGIDTPGIA